MRKREEKRSRKSKEINAKIPKNKESFLKISIEDHEEQKVLLFLQNPKKKGFFLKIPTGDHVEMEVCIFYIVIFFAQ